ncbi:MAG: shikimate dehydrogenase [Phycisphaeraceae bacterium]
MTRLTAAIMVRDLEQALADATRAAEFGADLVELRIDGFTDPDGVGRLLQEAPLPSILTCRPTWEGGEYAGGEAERLSLLEQAVQGVRAPTYLDLELAAWEQAPAEMRERLTEALETAGTGLILSAHDFEHRPRDLLSRIAKMAEVGPCRVIKLAWRARSLRDNLEAFEILGQQYKPTIALCMGRFGLPSRALAKKFGALLSFASIDEASGTAPGQPTLDEIKKLYRWDRLGADTRVYGVIGWPVGHSMSPAVHNRGFDESGYDGVYLPMPIPPEYEHFKATVGSWLAMEELGFGGASVTIPHKENLLRFVREQGGEIEPLAARIGAANTLTKRTDGTLFASNTDYAAALDAVCDALSIEREKLAGKAVAVVGAGGAARAVVAGFAAYGGRVTVYNRTRAKAEALAAEFGGESGSVAAAGLEALPGASFEVLINCTPIGMHPEVEASPVDGEGLPDWGPGTVVFDTIYNPLETKLLRQAKAAGCLTVPGTEMFVRQAAAQFELWTGQTAPLEAFRGVLRERLGAGG